MPCSFWDFRLKLFFLRTVSNKFSLSLLYVCLSTHYPKKTTSKPKMNMVIYTTLKVLGQKCDVKYMYVYRHTPLVAHAFNRSPNLNMLLIGVLT